MTNLFLGREGEAQRTCPRTVNDLPKEVTAEYLNDSVYLVTASSDRYKFRNYTSATSEPVIVPGFLSCLIRPPCDGHFESYSGNLELRADWRSCGHGNGSILYIRQPTVLASVLGKVERDLLRKPAPPQLKRELQERVMEANRLKLITLPDDAIYSGSIEEIMKPLAEEVVPNRETRVFSKHHGFCRFDHSTGDDSNWTRDFGSCAAWTTHLPAETLPDPRSNSRRQANRDIDLRQFQQRSGLSHTRQCESPQDEGS